MTDTTMLPEKLQAIDRALLTPLVRQLFRSEAVEVLDWHLTPIQFGIINPLTFGIFRISGTANDNHAILSWTMVLKILQPAVMLPLEVWQPQNSLFSMNRELSAYR